MGCCSGRCFVLSVCVLQLVATVERQIFDFLGYMWAPILGNFLQIIFVILGFFGSFQYRPKYLIAYLTWAVIWIGWNTFVVCVYLEVGILRKDNFVLNMGTGSRSWWESNGFGCNPKYNASFFTEDGWRRPVAVDDCLLDFEYVEVLHAGIQLLLTLLGLIGGCYIAHVYTEEDDSSRARKNVPAISYSIEYQQQPSQENSGQRPMTPRKVKRRSTRSKRSTSGHRQSYYQNPVTRIMERSAIPTTSAGGGGGGADSSSSNESYGNLPPPSYSSGHSAPPSYSSAASSMNIMGLDAADTNYHVDGGVVNHGYASHHSSRSHPRPASVHNSRLSPIYMNQGESVI